MQRLGWEIPVVLYDGWCPLCVGAVESLLRMDRSARLRFARLDSDPAAALLEKAAVHDVDVEAIRTGSTFGLVERGEVFTRSDAAWRVAAQLSMPWRLGGLLRFLPRRLRNAAYSAVARRRHRVWTRRDSCHMPGPADRERFL